MIMTPDQALQTLRDGNRAYLKNPTVHFLADDRRRRQLTAGQSPIACVVCCSDSRVPPEFIFYAGLGVLFVIRTAGNVIGPHERGSIEYAVTHLHIPLVVVMGHTCCGAVQAALEGEPDGHIAPILEAIRHNAAGSTDPHQVAWANARSEAADLAADPDLAGLIANGDLIVTSALYDIESGLVSFEED
jgi:carbonic anhydrase